MALLFVDFVSDISCILNWGCQRLLIFDIHLHNRWEMFPILVRQPGANLFSSARSCRTIKIPELGLSRRCIL